MNRIPPKVLAHGATDVGRVRSGNEDNYYVGDTVFAVADGMGGHAGGEVASAQALQPIEQLDGAHFTSAESASGALAEAIVEANRIVHEQGRDDPELSGMGTTLTAALLRDGRLHVAHVGDSRAYLLRDDDDLTPLTTDHTLVEQMVRDGQLSRAEAAVHPHRSVLTRAVGVDHEVQVDSLTPLPLQPGDQVLLCSDGLTGPVEETDIRRLLHEHDDAELAVQGLIDAANDAGGPDNITVVLLRVEEQRAEVAAATGEATDLSTGDGHPDERPVNTKAISTRPDREADDADWARQFGRYGQQQGAQRGGGDEPGGSGRRRAAKVTAVVVGVVLLAGLIGGGGYALLSRAYFVGNLDGQIAVFNGVPQTVAGLDLHWVVEETDLPVDELPGYMQAQLDRGVTATSRAEAEAVVERYEARIRESERQREAEEEADDGDEEEAGDTDDEEADDADDVDGNDS